MAAPRGRSERDAEEVHTALRVAVRPEMDLGERKNPLSASDIRESPAQR